MISRRTLRIGAVAAIVGIGLLASRWEDVFEKRVRVVEEGRLVRGAWQRPGPLRRLITREKIRTIVTLTAINRDDPKYVDQQRVVRETGVDWILIPMRGSTATLEQMARAADLLADPNRQPVFFHCVGGHHRTGLVHAAYRIRHEGWSAQEAWRELEALPWTRPDHERDRADRRLIEAFAEKERRHEPARKEAGHEALDDSQGGPTDRRGASDCGTGHRLALEKR